jgi:metal-responsive CopG/Arc/MetJ family transcriptional regulator
MRTTLNLTADLDKLIEETGETNKSKAVDTAINEFLRRKAIDRLLAARGKYPWMVDKTAEWRKEELRLETEERKQQGW